MNLFHYLSLYFNVFSVDSVMLLTQSDSLTIVPARRRAANANKDPFRADENNLEFIAYATFRQKQTA